MSDIEAILFMKHPNGGYSPIRYDDLDRAIATCEFYQALGVACHLVDLTGRVELAKQSPVIREEENVVYVRFAP